MSGASGANGGMNGLIGPGVVIAIVVAAFLWFTTKAEETALRQSATGFDGLAAWLDDQGADVEVKTTPWPAPAEEYGLRIQPIYDTRPKQDRAAPKTEDELLQQIDERDEDYREVFAKKDLIPTIYVLPKWRTGMRLSRRAHPDFTIGPAALGQWILSPQVYPGALTADGDGLRDYPVAGSRLRAALYAPQVFRDGECEPLVGDRQAMILAECETYDRAAGAYGKVWVLSDPDLLNNHGLSLGDNAAIAALLLPEIAGDRRIVVDYTQSAWSDVAQAETPKRTWSDLLRFFAYPDRKSVV